MKIDEDRPWTFWPHNKICYNVIWFKRTGNYWQQGSLHLSHLRRWQINLNKEAGRLYAELLSLVDDIWHPHVICTSCRQHPHIIRMSWGQHPELLNFMTWLVFICYIVSAESFDISLIFGWTLSVQDVSLISFGRIFCNLFLDQFGFEYCFW